MSIRPDKAARLTRLAWLGVVGATVFAVGVHLLPPPSTDVSVDPLPLPIQPGTSPDGGESPQSTVAWVELAGVMDEIKPFEHSTQVVVNDPPPSPDSMVQDPTEDDPTRVPSGVPGWHYVGSVDVGGSLNAVVMVESRQHFAGVGDVIDGFEIVEVDEQYLDIQSQTQPRRRVDREQAIKPQLQASGRIPGRPGARPGTELLEDPEERLERLREERERNRGGGL